MPHKKSSLLLNRRRDIYRTKQKTFSQNITLTEDNLFDKIGELKWRYEDIFYIVCKIDYEAMHQAYGTLYTKKLLMALINHDYGNFYLKLKSVLGDVLLYLGTEDPIPESASAVVPL
jgi:hypothetical protein